MKTMDRGADYNMKRYVSALMALCLMFTLMPPVEAKETETFSDVPTDFWAYEQINRCVQDGIVSGYADGTFKPGNPVSYGAFSIMLARAFYPNELASYSSQSTATGETIMNKHGILNGTSRSSASIGAFLPRGDMAQIMYNILVDKGAAIPSASEYTKAMNSMSDYNAISGNCRRGVLVCYTLGLLGGQSDGSFGPKNPMNRAQGCVVINRLRDYIGNTTETPVDPSETPSEITLPEFKLGDGETVAQMMNRITANITYTPGYLSNGKPITEDNIKEIMEAMKVSMPEGTEWDTSSRYYYNSKIGSGFACDAWAYSVSDYLFTKDAPVYRHQNFGQLKVGDVVWIRNSSSEFDHFVVVTSLSSKWNNAYDTCDGNRDGKVSWSSHEGYGVFDNSDFAPYTYIYSRY